MAKIPSTAPLQALFVDDDSEIVEQCKALLPDEIEGSTVEWTTLDSFDQAIAAMDERKFDLVVTDVYKGRALTGKLNVNEVDNQAKSVVGKAKSIGFSFIVMYSDGACPADIELTASLQFVDKAKNEPPFPESVCDVLGEMLRARGAILSVMSKLRHELERDAGGFIWSFLEANWDTLSVDPEFGETGLERLIRRRVAIQMNEMIGAQGMMRRSNADQYDYYVMPVLPGDLRLGTLLTRPNDQGELEYHLVLTPHCHMVSFKGSPPKADTVLIAACILSTSLTSKSLRELDARQTRIPASNVGKPEGRYCFLPGFCSIPDLFVDVMSLQSVSYDDIDRVFVRVATVDSPFAEAIQSSVSRFYANVGHRNLIDYSAMK